MANTYKWYINELESYPDFQGYTDFVTTVKWRYNATNENGIVANIFGQTTFNEVNDTPIHPYVPYSQLTEIEVQNWLDTYNDITTLRTQLDNNINEQINPAVVNLALPW